MKTNLFILLLLFAYSSLNAQDSYRNPSDAEQFCNAPGKTITGVSLFNNVYGYDLINDKGIALMKFIDKAGNSSILGVIFYVNIGKTDYTESKKYKIILDTCEVSSILKWMDDINQNILNINSSGVDYLSYSPKKGNIIFYLLKAKSNKDVNEIIWTNNSDYIFGIQYDKENRNSLVIDKISHFNKLYDSLKEIQKILGKNGIQ